MPHPTRMRNYTALTEMICTGFRRSAAALLVVTLYITACTKDQERGAEGRYDVDPALEPYVQAFVDEGAKRGHEIDFSESGLKIEFSDRQLEFAGGFCYVGDYHIVINKSVWQDGFEDYKTRLIFHELGHCELNRSHKNDRFANQVWKSLMRGDPLNPAERRIPVPFTGFRKEYYIDELFDPGTSTPGWANPDFTYGEVSVDALATVEEQDSIHRFYHIVPSSVSQYEIEVKFVLSDLPTQSTRLTWGTPGLTYSITFIAKNLYRVDAQQAGTGVFLYVGTNTDNVGGREVDKITVRKHEGFEKIFFNDQFIFHMDPLPGDLHDVRFESTENITDILNLDLVIEQVKISRLL